MFDFLPTETLLCWACKQGPSSPEVLSSEVVDVACNSTSFTI